MIIGMIGFVEIGRRDGLKQVRGLGFIGVKGNGHGTVFHHGFFDNRCECFDIVDIVAVFGMRHHRKIHDVIGIVMGILFGNAPVVFSRIFNGCGRSAFAVVGFRGFRFAGIAPIGHLLFGGQALPGHGLKTEKVAVAAQVKGTVDIVFFGGRRPFFFGAVPRGLVLHRQPGDVAFRKVDIFVREPFFDEIGFHRADLREGPAGAPRALIFYRRDQPFGHQIFLLGKAVAVFGIGILGGNRPRRIQVFLVEQDARVLREANNAVRVTKDHKGSDSTDNHQSSNDHNDDFPIVRFSLFHRCPPLFYSVIIP